MFACRNTNLGQLRIFIFSIIAAFREYINIPKIRLNILPILLIEVFIDYLRMLRFKYFLGERTNGNGFFIFFKLRKTTR
jgi:hypothetical protein